MRSDISPKKQHKNKNKGNTYFSGSCDPQKEAEPSVSSQLISVINIFDGQSHLIYMQGTLYSQQQMHKGGM